MRQWSFRFVLLFFLFFVKVRTGSADTRIAVIGTSKTNDAGVIELAEVALSRRSEFAIVERQRIDRLLAEQELSASGLIDATEIVRAGRILPVDLFVFVEQSEDGTETLGCVVYSAVTGVRLSDEGLVGKDVAVIADDIVRVVDRAVGKRALNRGDRRTVSVVAVRNADLPQSMDTSCQSLATFYERRLVQSEEVVVLERSRLSVLQQEKSLSAAADRQLLSSVLQADLEFSREAEGVKAILTLTDSRGSEHLRIAKVGDGLSVSLIEPLVTATAKKLNLSEPPNLANRRIESERYFHEAKRRSSYGHHHRAIECAESALMLDPDQEKYTQLLAELLFRFAKEELLKLGRQQVHDPDKYRSILDLGERATDLFLKHIRQSSSKSSQSSYSYSRTTFSLNRSCSNFYSAVPSERYLNGPKIGLWQPLRAGILEQITSISLEKVAAWKRLLHQRRNAKDPMKQATAFRSYTIALGRELTDLKGRIRDDAAYISFAAKLADDWLDELADWPSGLRPHQSFSSVLRDLTGPSASRLDALPECKQLLQRLTEHEEPVIRAYGRRGVMFAGVADIENTGEIFRQFRRIREDAMAYLAKPLSQVSIRSRLALYEFLYESINAISLRHDGGLFSEELSAICEPMLERNEIHLRMMNGWGRQFDQASAAHSLKLLERGIRVCDSPNRLLLDSHDPQYVKGQLQKTKADLLVRFPNLRLRQEPWEIQTKLLMDIGSASPRHNILCHPVVGNDTVHVVRQSKSLSSESVQELSIVSVSLKDGSKSVTDAVDVRYEVNGSYSLTNLVTDSCLHGDLIYVATRQGIVQFNARTKAAEFIAAAESLPTKFAQSIASLAGRIYAGLDGGYLVSFGPDDDTCVVHISSRRKQKRSALDDREAFRIPYLVADSAGDRLFLACATATVNNPTTEVWEYHPRTQLCRKMLQQQTNLLTLSNVSDGRMLIATRYWMIPLSVASLKSLPYKELSSSQSPHRHSVESIYLRTPLICAGRIWSVGARQSLLGNVVTCDFMADDEQVIPVRIPELPKEEVYSGWFATPADEDRFLICNHHRLWLATPTQAE